MVFSAVGPFGLGPLELVVILVILVMIFGASRLADIGGSLGKGINEFRKNVKDTETEEAAPDAASESAPSVASTSSAATISAVKCPSCGALNEATAKHCNQCGTAIGAPVT